MAKNNQHQFDDFGQEIDRGYPMKRKGGKRRQNNVINIQPARNPEPMTTDKNQPNQTAEKSVVEETVVRVLVDDVAHQPFEENKAVDLNLSETDMDDDATDKHTEDHFDDTKVKPLQSRHGFKDMPMVFQQPSIVARVTVGGGDFPSAVLIQLNKSGCIAIKNYHTAVNRLRNLF